MLGRLINSNILVGLLMLWSMEFSEGQPTPTPWSFDSISPSLHSTPSEVAGQGVYDLLIKMVTRWNAHDLDGYLNCFWKDPALTVVCDSEIYIGWQEFNFRYTTAFSKPEYMGVITPNRIQVRMVRDDLAFAITRWTVILPKSGHTLVGIDTNYLQRFDDGWKVITTHTSSTEM